jgi:DNA-binding NarL/FixJ family response regulator
MKQRRRKIRIFLVEDHPAIARGVRMFLETVGHSVRIAGDVKSALAMAPKITFDVLLCDLNLPDGTGWDLMQQLSASGPVPAIAFSAFDDPPDIERSRRAGFAEHVSKGAPADKLVKTIERVARAGQLSKGGSANDAVPLARTHSAKRRAAQPQGSSTRLTSKAQ